MRRKNDGRSSLRARISRWIAPCLCLAVVAMAVVVGVRVVRNGSEVQRAFDADATGSAHSQRDALDVESSGREEGHAALMGAAGGADEETPETAIVALDKWVAGVEGGARDILVQTSGEASVELTVSSDLVGAAGDTLRAYQERDTARLRNAGYLDLKGNAWGALVQDERGWVDIAIVTAEGDARQSTVRIVRICAGGSEVGDGSDEERNAS